MIAVGIHLSYTSNFLGPRIQTVSESNLLCPGFNLVLLAESETTKVNSQENQCSDSWVHIAVTSAKSTPQPWCFVILGSSLVTKP